MSTLVSPSKRPGGSGSARRPQALHSAHLAAPSRRAGKEVLVGGPQGGQRKYSASPSLANVLVSGLGTPHPLGPGLQHHHPDSHFLGASP